MKFKDRAADALSNAVGSWTFVIGQAVFLAVWFTLNTVGWFEHWDTYPFVLANLFMSAEAAFTGPILLMSGNRAAADDRRTFLADLAEDKKTNEMVIAIAKKLGVGTGD